MKLLRGFLSLFPVLGMIATCSPALGQILPGSPNLAIKGSFTNGAAESGNSILITDNDLTNGYRSGFDLTDAPSSLNPVGPSGSAAFQWGVPSSNSAYPHSSSLWFAPLSIGSIAPEQSFELGYLFYRNGTIKSNTGATWVDIALTVSINQPLGMDPLSVMYGTELINSTNGKDPVASADIVSLRDQAAPIGFTDSHGRQYYLELTFQVDQDTIDGTLSTQDEFRVFEGGQGRATLLGRFTTSPVTLGGPMVPEPSSALLGCLGVFFLIRRKR